MFNRNLLLELEKWRLSKNRKPLVIRGARQVGKTTLVNQFAKQYDQYIYLNLELVEDKAPFENFSSIDFLITTLFFLKNKSLSKKTNTLLFIDEMIDNGLDTQGVESALGLLKQMSRERHKSIWLVSHRDELAGRVENILKVIKENGFTSYNTDIDVA